MTLDVLPSAEGLRVAYSPASSSLRHTRGLAIWLAWWWNVSRALRCPAEPKPLEPAMCLLAFSILSDQPCLEPAQAGPLVQENREAQETGLTHPAATLGPPRQDEPHRATGDPHQRDTKCCCKSPGFGAACYVQYQ